MHRNQLLPLHFPRLLSSLQCPSPDPAATLRVWVSSMTDTRQTSAMQRNVTLIWIFMLFLRVHTKCQQKMKCAHSQCSNSFVFMFILSNFALLFEVYGKILATWDNEPLRTERRMGHTFSLYTKCRKLCRQRFFFCPGPKTRRRRRLRHEHVSVPIFVILFRLLFSVVASKIRKYFVHRFIRLSNCPDNQSIHPFIHPSFHSSIHSPIHLSNGLRWSTKC